MTPRPTRGRIVDLHDAANLEPLPAIVVRVCDDGALNVVAFSDSYPLTCARLYRGVLYRELALGGLWWDWPEGSPARSSADDAQRRPSSSEPDKAGGTA